MPKFRKKKKDTSGLHPLEASFLKLYTEEEMNLIKAHDVEKLKLLVAEANAHVMKAKSEMEANPEFQTAKQKMDDFRGAFSDTKKFADSKKMLCLYILQTKGIVDCGANEEL